MVTPICQPIYYRLVLYTMHTHPYALSIINCPIYHKLSYLSVCLSVGLSIYLSIDLYIYLSIYLSIYYILLYIASTMIVTHSCHPADSSSLVCSRNNTTSTCTPWKERLLLATQCWQTWWVDLSNVHEPFTPIPIHTLSI